MKKFIEEIQASIYNPKFYKSLPSEQPLSHSIKYVAKLSLLVALVSTVVFAFQMPGLKRTFVGGIANIAAAYPADLVVSVSGGTASMNKPDPYILPLSSGIKESLAKNNNFSDIQNFLVIDTTKPFSEPDFESYHTLAWLTKTELITYKDTNGQLQIVPLNKIGNATIDKTWVQDKQTKLIKLISYFLPLVIPLFGLMLFVVDFVGSLILNFIYAFMIYLMGEIMKQHLSYKNSYRIGLHALTLLMGWNILALAFGIPNNLFIRLVMLISIVYLNFFKDLKIEKEIEPPTENNL